MFHSPLKMSRFFIGLTAFMLLLTSCLSQNDPKVQSSPAKTLISGIVIMRDWHGRGMKKPEAHILAQFAKKANQSAQIRGALRHPELGSLTRDNGQALKCTIDRQAKTKASGAATDTTVSIGKLAFGPSGATELVNLDEGDNHLYRHDLESGFTAGKYAIRSEGSANTSAFGITMGVPENLGHVTAAGQDFDLSATAFRRSEPLKLTWDAPVGVDDKNYNQVEIEIISDTATETMTLSCGAMESDLMTDSSTVTLEIPTPYLQSLNATTSGFILVKRAQVIRATDQNIGEIIFQGLRISVTQALISE